jgi:hypothetical protein
MMSAMNFDDLLAIELPTRSVKVQQHEFDLKALSAHAIDDMITRYPSPKNSNLAFGDELRFELIARTITNVELTVEQVKHLFEVWSRPDVSVLQDACFELNWRGNIALPLSENGSEPTDSSPQN